MRYCRGGTNLGRPMVLNWRKAGSYIPGYIRFMHLIIVRTCIGKVLLVIILINSLKIYIFIISSLSYSWLTVKKPKLFFIYSNLEVVLSYLPQVSLTIWPFHTTSLIMFLISWSEAGISLGTSAGRHLSLNQVKLEP